MTTRAKKTSEAETAAGDGAPWLTRKHSIVIAGSGIGLIALALVSRGLWTYVRPHVLTSAQFQISPTQIHVTPAPAWIRADVKAEALQEASLDAPRSMFDDEGEAPLVQRLSRAFASHPWVAEVKRVEKDPPLGVRIELVYREPVLMVEVPGGLYPVDKIGAVLPTGDFLLNKQAMNDVQRYARLSGGGSAPSGPVGTRWGDPRVEKGAQLAAALQAHWAALGLAKITPLSVGEKEPPAFMLHTTGGVPIVWGHAPGDEASQEAPAAEKLARLLRLASGKTLDGPQAPRSIDLRPWREPVVQARLTK